MSVSFQRAAWPALLFLCALSLAAAVPEAAADDYYLRGKLGTYAPQADDVDQLDPGFGVEVTLGKSILPLLSAELSAGYYEASDGPVELTVKPVTLALRLRAPIPVFKPYAVAGGGAYFSKLETEGAGSESDTSFGYFLGAGVDFKVLVLLLNVEAKYFWSQPTFAGKTDIDGVVLSAGIGLQF